MSTVTKTQQKDDLLPVHSLSKAAKALGQTRFHIAELVKHYGLITQPMGSNPLAKGLTLKDFQFLRDQIERQQSKNSKKGRPKAIAS